MYRYKVTWNCLLAAISLLSVSVYWLESWRGAGSVCWP